MASEHFDDPNIPNAERLFRRIHLTHVVEGEGGISVVSTAAFRDVELSVNLESVMQGAGRAPEDSLKHNPGDLLMSLTAGLCRDQGQLVGPDPIAEDQALGVPAEPAHAYVYGKKSRTVQKALRDAAAWVIPAESPLNDEIKRRKVQLGLVSADPVD